MENGLFKTKFKETEIGMIPEEWGVKELGDIGNLKNGINYNRTDVGKGLKVVSVKQLFRGEFVSFNNLNSVKKDSISNYEKYILKEGDLLFARGSLKRDGAGKLAIVRKIQNKDTVFSGFIIRFRNESKNDNLFLNYLLRSPIYRELFPRIATGTTITNLTQEILNNVPIILPPLQEQKAIAKILSDLDSKIELLQKQNKTLENIGQVIFKYWFVDFEFPNENGKPYKSSGGKMIDSELGEIPEGWSVGNYGNLLEFKRGIEPGSKNYLNKKEKDTILFHRVGDLVSDSTLYVKKDIIKNKICLFNDILVSFDGTVGRVKFGLEGSYSTGIRKVYSKSNQFSDNFIYFLMKSKFIQDKIKEFAKGTTILHAGESIKHFITTIPNKKTLDLFNKTTDSSFESLLNNTKEIKTLQKTRDLLLPKLMSGKIRVKY